MEVDVGLIQTRCSLVMKMESVSSRSWGTLDTRPDIEHLDLNKLFSWVFFLVLHSPTVGTLDLVSWCFITTCPRSFDWLFLFFWTSFTISKASFKQYQPHVNRQKNDSTSAPLLYNAVCLSVCATFFTAYWTANLPSGSAGYCLLLLTVNLQWIQVTSLFR